MDRRQAAIDIILLLIVFWFINKGIDLEFIASGPATVLGSTIYILMVMRMRKLSFADLGMFSPESYKLLARHTFTIIFLIFIIQAVGIFLANLIGAAPTDSTAVEMQPDNFLPFIWDIVFFTWIITGIGEELIFRGFILNRLQAIFPSKGNYLVASLLQAAWFGLGHSSQGISGILITGIIGFALAQYYLRNREIGLWPLILSHALVDTVVLSANFLSKL